MDIKSFTSAVAQIAEEKGIPAEKVQDIIEQAIASAYKKDYGKKGQVIKAELNPATGQAKFWQVKLVVDSSMILAEEELVEKKEKEIDEPSFAKATEGEEKIRFNSERHILLKDAKKINPKIKINEELEISLEAKGDYGRIAAQTAKQVILQRIREAERDIVFEEYKAKEDEIISGIIQRIEGTNVFVDIGKTLGVLPKEEQVRGEFYRFGQRLKFYILKVEKTSRGSVIFLSRAYPKIISQLFELEVPEISQGLVQIKSVAREAGSRSKVAVISTQEEIDPIGSMVGQRGTRVQAVINELGGERIDIIEYVEDQENYIANSLSPAKIEEVKILPRNKALAICREDQLSLAIGKDGQNVRLAAKLTGWKIDIRSVEKAKEEPGEEEPDEKEKGSKKKSSDIKSASPAGEAIDAKEKKTTKDEKATKKKETKKKTTKKNK
ncbi:transcription termination/antitermination protein NusA [Patescibacteria group bacterium]|nr:transcription termination/antitermination protein NusA [Patescibacteria group bacterium]